MIRSITTLFSLFLLFSFQLKANDAFVKNNGQIRNASALFVKDDGAFQFFLRQGGFSYQFRSLEQYDEETMLRRIRSKGLNDLNLIIKTHRVDVDLVGANPNPVIAASRPTSSNKRHSRAGGDWLEAHQRVVYKDVYDGIDLVFDVVDGQVKYDFIVSPGANPNQIQLAVSHHDALRINDHGDLVVGTTLGEVSEQSPVSFQGDRRIQTRFELKGNTVRFKLGRYDKNKALRIDPSVLWSTYVGGNTLEFPVYTAQDAWGNLYTSGTTFSTDLATPGAHQTSLSAASDAYLAKYSESGQLIWATYYGGNAATNGTGCAVDSAGSVYLTGETRSTNDIATPGAHQTTFAGAGSSQGDAFLVKFDSTGSRLWGTYFGGAEDDAATFCTVDVDGDVYISGQTTSPTGLVSNGHQLSLGGNFDAFLAKFSASGTHQWSTYYGGGALDIGNGISTNPQGDVFLSGTTASTDSISTAGVHQASPIGGITSAFLVKFNSSGSRIWGTYYGGNGEELGWNCAADNNGNVYLVGGTSSNDDISSVNAHQEIKHGVGSTNYDGFIAKLDAQGDLVWGTFYGGIFNDEILDVHVGQDSNVYISGYTNSTNNHPTFSVDENIATSGSHLVDVQGGLDGFVAVFTPQGQREWGSYFGGPNNDVAQACVTFNNSGEVYIGGQTNSPSGIASMNAFKSSLTATNQGFLAKFDACNTVARPVFGGCDAVLSPSGDSLYDASGVYYDTLTNRFGCDSIIITTLELTDINTGIRVSDIFMESREPDGSNVSYDWLDCNNNLASIGGIITRRFFPSGDGVFAVEVTVDGCVDTSACTSFRYLTNEAFDDQNKPLKVYPNPTNRHVQIESMATGHIALVSALGQEVMRASVMEGEQASFDLGRFASGAYTLVFVNEQTGERVHVRLLIQSH